MVSVSDLTKAYGKKTVLQGISFEALPGEMLVVCGPNGAGKSTLLNILSGLVRPDGGSISYFGHDMTQRRSRKLFVRYCGLVPQSGGLMEELSVQDNLSLWSGKSGRPDERLLQLLHLEELLPLRVKELSGGMKKRAAIACAMVNFPPVLLMDEPGAALDKEQRASLYAFMQDYRKKNGILIIASHEDEELAMADKKLTLSNQM